MPEETSNREGFFGERAASVYDEHVSGMFNPATVGPVVELLADLAEDGRALTLQNPWAGWQREPFTSLSRTSPSTKSLRPTGGRRGSRSA